VTKLSSRAKYSQTLPFIITFLIRRGVIKSDIKTLMENEIHVVEINRFHRIITTFDSESRSRQR